MRADGGRAGYCRQPVGIRHEIPLGLVVQVKALACESPSSRGVPLARWSQGRARALRAGIRPGRHHQWQPDPAVALEGRKEIALKPIPQADDLPLVTCRRGAVGPGPHLDAGGSRGAQEEPQARIEALGRALGMTPQEIEALGLTPEEIENLLAGFTEETVVVGSRAQPRTVTASPVPVDVLSTAELSSQGSVNLQDQLRTIVPSFAVNTQPISDASTVVRPAMLRNLAPDHTLVLVNGKRRHRSSIIDWHGGNGVAFGSQGPDISAIPAIALRQVEVLRDGAAAQYGSDAIAGVMNFQLRDAASGGAVEYNMGGFGDGGGRAMNLGANAGLALGATGFANLSLEYGSAEPTNRSAPRSDALALRAAGNTDVASDTPQVWGSPDIDDDLKLFGNFGYTTAAGVQVYSHTNYASKRVTGGFFFRNPNTRGGVYSLDGGETLLIGDALLAGGMGSANSPTTIRGSASAGATDRLARRP